MVHRVRKTPAGWDCLTLFAAASLGSGLSVLSCDALPLPKPSITALIFGGLLGGSSDIVNLFLLVDTGGHLPSLPCFWLRQPIDCSISLLVQGFKERPTTVVSFSCSDSLGAAYLMISLALKHSLFSTGSPESCSGQIGG